MFFSLMQRPLTRARPFLQYRHRGFFLFVTFSIVDEIDRRGRVENNEMSQDVSFPEPGSYICSGAWNFFVSNNFLFPCETLKNALFL